VLPELRRVLQPNIRTRDALLSVLVMVTRSRDGEAIKRAIFVDSVSRVVRRADAELSPWKLTSRVARLEKQSRGARATAFTARNRHVRTVSTRFEASRSRRRTPREFGVS